MALIIGNARYPEAGTPLPTTVNDARALADELRRSDFDVDLKENVGKEDMQRAIDAFTSKIQSGSGALFYFSGLCIQVTRQNFLLPVNTQASSEADVQRDGISLDAVLSEMKRHGARV
ncbi:MAG: caspase family protein, partial [Xanthobacteraceae bacterium]